MRLLTLFPALLLFAALPASADALRCGEYRSVDDGMALVFTTPSSGYRDNGIGEPEPLWVDRSAAQTRLVMLDDGVAEPIRISADGRRIEDDVFVVYTLRQPGLRCRAQRCGRQLPRCWQLLHGAAANGLARPGPARLRRGCGRRLLGAAAAETRKQHRGSDRWRRQCALRAPASLPRARPHPRSSGLRSADRR
ncbi:hypothetical protein NMB32_04565 [Stenotrophomonas sp. CD2]|nr:hypothetical protein NMB32_04565 [Stenotrophomonas sp. CD2]